MKNKDSKAKFSKIDKPPNKIPIPFLFQVDLSDSEEEFESGAYGPGGPGEGGPGGEGGACSGPGE